LILDKKASRLTYRDSSVGSQGTTHGPIMSSTGDKEGNPRQATAFQCSRTNHRTSACTIRNPRDGSSGPVAQKSQIQTLAFPSWAPSSIEGDSRCHQTVTRNDAGDPCLASRPPQGTPRLPNGLSFLLLMLRNFQLLEHAVSAMKFYIAMSDNCRNALMRGKRRATHRKRDRGVETKLGRVVAVCYPAASRQRAYNS
jgi:hypothetical protein